MKLKLIACLAGFIVFAPLAFSQLETEDQGFRWKGLYFRPAVSALGAYDNRVLIPASGGALGDEYGEVEAGVGVKNLPARYDFVAGGSYGYRTYSQYTPLNDDFYKANAALGTDDGRLIWRLSVDETKSLNYNTRYDPQTGSGPDSVLVNTPNTRLQAVGSIAYNVPISDRTSLVPEYALQHYRQDIEGSTTTEWQEHEVALPLEYAYSEKSILTAGAAGTLQANQDEKGYIASVYVGAESRTTDKTTFAVRLGVSAAEYEFSGSDIGGISDARVLWKLTDKVEAYVFGGNNFQPGYGGGPARMVYRAGYGGKWTPAAQWFLEGQGLHDYEQALGSGGGSNAYGGVRHFYITRLGYKFVRWAELSAEGRYVKDEIDTDQVIASLRLGLSF